eukprot:8891073-Pyramimonas_sp.AAC.1
MPTQPERSASSHELGVRSRDVVRARRWRRTTTVSTTVRARASHTRPRHTRGARLSPPPRRTPSWRRRRLVVGSWARGGPAPRPPQTQSSPPRQSRASRSPPSRCAPAPACPPPPPSPCKHKQTDPQRKSAPIVRVEALHRAAPVGWARGRGVTP